MEHTHNGNHRHEWAILPCLDARNGRHYKVRASWEGDANTLAAESDIVTVAVTLLYPPVASFVYGLLTPYVGDIVTFNASASYDPDTLNLESKGKWFTCYIELPEGYDTGDNKRRDHINNERQTL